MSVTTTDVLFTDPALVEVHAELRQFAIHANNDPQTSQVHLAQSLLDTFEEVAPVNAGRWARAFLAGSKWLSGDSAVQLARVSELARDLA